MTIILYIKDQKAKLMTWLQRIKEGILTKTVEKKDAPEGIWVKCPDCRENVRRKELEVNLNVCPQCDYHHRIGSAAYFEILFDENKFEEHFSGLLAKDILKFTDLKAYPNLSLIHI